MSYLIGEIEEGDRQSSPVRDAMFKLSGRLGILNQTSDQVNLRIAMPEPRETAAIKDGPIRWGATGIDTSSQDGGRAQKERDH